MASKSNLLKKLQQQLAAFDDAALEAIANKGLLRRAKKDFQQGEIPELLSETETTLKLGVAEMVVTLPEQGVSKASCTCPAVETCRHILIVCLWLASAKEETATPSTFSLLTYTLDDLIKWAGKKTVRNGVNLLTNGLSSEITEAVPILIKFPELNIESRFFPSSGLEGMICSCKSREVCQHLVAAVLKYQQAQGIVIDVQDIQPISLSEVDGSPRSRTEIIQACKMLLEEIITIGLCHLSISIQQRFTTLAVSTSGVNLPRLSLELRRIADDVELGINCDAQSDDSRLFLSAARTYALCQALENLLQNQKPDQIRTKELIGESRSQYDSVNTLELAGMGAYHWQTKSGYEGLTILFWDINAKKWCSWSDTRPLFKGAGFSPQVRYRQLGPWTGLLSPQQASHSRFQLMAARRNAQNRLSSSSLSHATLIGQTDPQQIDLDNCSFQNWNSLRVYAASVVKTGLSEYDPLREIVVVKPTAWEKKLFDNVSQTFIWQIVDDQGEILPLQVSFQPVDEQRIKTLESLEPELIKVYGIVAQLIVDRSSLSLYPISLLSQPATNSQTILNLSFALEFDQKTQTNSESQVNLDLDKETQISSIELRIESLVDEMQYLAQRGSSYLNQEIRQYLAREANMFSNGGLEVIACCLRSLSNCSDNANSLLLKLRYLCQLCQEVAVQEGLNPLISTSQKNNCSI